MRATRLATLDESGRVVGRITLNGIVRGAFQSAAMGYWIGAAHNGRGLATAAVRDVLRRIAGRWQDHILYQVLNDEGGDRPA